MRFRRTNSNNSKKQPKNYSKAHGIVLESHNFSKRWIKTHEMRTKSQSPNSSNLEPEIKTKETEEGWSKDNHQHCRHWGCLRVGLNAFPYTRVQWHAQASRSHTCLLVLLFLSYSPEAHFTNRAVRFLLQDCCFYWNKFLCKSEIKISYCPAAVMTSSWSQRNSCHQYQYQ